MGHLTLLLALPLLGAGLIGLIPGDRRGAIRRVAVAASGSALLVSVWLAYGFDPTATGMQYAETLKWNPRLGTYYALGLDGLSLPLVLLATLLALVAVLASRGIKDRPKGYYLLLLVLESAMLGVFMAQDWALFYVFWELTLIPLFFLIDRWGGKNRHAAALNFVLYTMGGSVFMLIALLVLFDAVPGHSFFMADMIARGAGPAAGDPGDDLPGVPDRLRRQDAALPHPRLAAAGARGGPQSGQHPALRHPAEDGLLRVVAGGLHAPRARGRRSRRRS